MGAQSVEPRKTRTAAAAEAAAAQVAEAEGAQVAEAAGAAKEAADAAPDELCRMMEEADMADMEESQDVPQAAEAAEVAEAAEAAEEAEAVREAEMAEMAKAAGGEGDDEGVPAPAADGTGAPPDLQRSNADGKRVPGGDATRGSAHFENASVLNARIEENENGAAAKEAAAKEAAAKDNGDSCAPRTLSIRPLCSLLAAGLAPFAPRLSPSARRWGCPAPQKGLLPPVHRVAAADS